MDSVAEGGPLNAEQGKDERDSATFYEFQRHAIMAFL
ncbi:hypothetical protein COLO4_23927 [Corchorus olitorius]|uniref:Uncharacterized protein n=1 Tax=Corchorus olitorius TaxID=93759 RepID=A0A1R3IE79_9ROSI|nr:hypothetical protein COLO4_23927 [Corchorus olitorius]